MKSHQELALVNEVKAEEVFVLFEDVYAANVANERIGGRWTKGLVQSELARGLSVGLLCPAGFLKSVVLYRNNPDNLEVVMLGTDPRWRRRGLMRHLLTELKLKAQGCGKQIWLEVHAQNESAIGLYKKLGFSQTGERPRYYADGSAALLMSWSSMD